MSDDQIQIQWRGDFDDAAVQRVHDLAFGEDRSPSPDPWSERAARWSLGWVTARDRGELVGFLNVLTDGGTHAWLQNVVVAPDHQQAGIGEAMVEQACARAGQRGCIWMHVDFAPEAATLYFDRCGFLSTDAGLRRLQ